MNSKKSFTIIELLVVIAITGLLSSIVLVSIKGARERAYTAKLLQFSSSIKNASGAYLMGEWGFEESGDNTCSGSPPYNDICDISGNDNHGQNNGMTREDHEGDGLAVLGQAGSFEGGDYVSTSRNTSSLDELTENDRMTVEVWVKPKSSEGNILDWHCHFGLYIFDGSPGVRIDSLDAIFHTETVLETDKWNHVVFTQDGEDIKFFINTNEVDPSSEEPLSSEPSCFLTSLTIGGGNFQGSVDNVRLYDDVITLGH